MLLFGKLLYYIKDNFRSLFIFGIVGTLTAVVYFTLFGFLFEILQLNSIVSVSISYFLAVLFHFFCNRHFTFKKAHIHLRKQLLKYSLMVLINYLFTLIIVQSLTKMTGFSPYIGILIAVISTTLLGYILSKHWVFQRT